MRNRLNKNERGFALPISLLLFVVMTIMGLTLVTITSKEHSANIDKDNSQQVFYAAESGISIGIGSGGNYALAAGKVLMGTDMSAEEVAKKAIEVASEICVFTNNNIKIEKI